MWSRHLEFREDRLAADGKSEGCKCGLNHETITPLRTGKMKDARTKHEIPTIKA